MPENEKEVEFSSLTFKESAAKVDERTGNQPERIRHPHELLDLKGQTIYLVTSPFGQENNIGTCFILTWEVGTVMDHRGNLVEKDKPLTFDNDEKYILTRFNNNNELLSLKDFNIIPNSYNNHAAFSTKEAAEAYVMYRKMCFPEDPTIADLEGDYTHFFEKEDLDRLLKSEAQATKKATE